MWLLLVPITGRTVPQIARQCEIRALTEHRGLPRCKGCHRGSTGNVDGEAAEGVAPTDPIAVWTSVGTSGLSGPSGHFSAARHKINAINRSLGHWRLTHYLSTDAGLVDLALGKSCVTARSNQLG